LNYIDIVIFPLHTLFMPRTRMDELYALAEEHDGLLKSKEARALGIRDSVLVRLAQRGRLERMTRGVYRIAHYPTDRFAQYREAVLWAQANHHGPERIALSHETALLLYGISDVNPARVNLTVPKSARLRRKHPEWIMVHRANLTAEEVSLHEGMPVTIVERSIMDVLSTTHRTDVAREAITDALREGLISTDQARSLRKIVNRSAHSVPLSTMGTPVEEAK
jgi:predicted transcriptional regulator of viral defense system